MSARFRTSDDQVWRYFKEESCDNDHRYQGSFLKHRGLFAARKNAILGKANVAHGPAQNATARRGRDPAHELQTMQSTRAAIWSV
jgi:hypothetical protein